MNNLRKTISIIGFICSILLLVFGSFASFFPGAEISYFFLTSIISLTPIIASKEKKMRIIGIILFGLSLAGLYFGLDRQKKYFEWVESKTYTSFSGKYKIKASINQDKSDPAKRRCIIIHLLNVNGEELTQMQTDASDAMKWALGWSANTEKDIVILYSGDIGTQAWEITPNNNFARLIVSEKILQEGDSMREFKYH